jgi:DNA-binding transcriptional regulator LsrR (DeoR family)
MTKIDELRLMTKAARMYYVRDMRQNEIAEKLGISQATVSRLLRNAKQEGVIRINVSIPSGVNTEIEEGLIQKYGLKEAIVVDSPAEDGHENEQILLREIGSAAAYYVETTIKNHEVVGISSWSETLLALVDAMQQAPGKAGIRVVQILGGIGNPSAEVHANRLTGRLTSLVNGTPPFLPAPGVVGSEAASKVILNDPYVQEAFSYFDHISMALVGIGAIQPSKLLTYSGNIFSAGELETLKNNGAVGDILLRFFDAQGNPVTSPINDRVVSMSLEQLKRVERAIGVATGKRKYAAILGAVRGKWINVLVTDRHTAQRLMEEA